VPVKLLYGVIVSVRLVVLLGVDVMDVGTRLMVK